MLKQQRKAAGYVPGSQLGLLKVKLEQAGYEVHDGPRYRRNGEVLTLRAAFEGRDGLRQNHVQVVDRHGVYAVYAHTEPHTQRFIAHALSAANDEASFSGGSRMLRNDLESVGFRLRTHAEARAGSNRRR